MVNSAALAAFVGAVVVSSDRPSRSAAAVVVALFESGLFGLVLIAAAAVEEPVE